MKRIFGKQGKKRKVTEKSILYSEQEEVIFEKRILNSSRSTLVQGEKQITKVGTTLGTAAYMSPEQTNGAEVDHRSDIFSYGVLLFEMLTSKLPFRGEHEAAMVYSIVNEDPAPIQNFLPEISGEIVHILGKALEKNPDDRYKSIQDLIVDLRRSKKDTSRVMKVSSLHQEPTALRMKAAWTI